MQNPKITAILLNYNGSEDTIACYESLIKASYANLHIVVVDNLSPDGSFDKLNAYFSNHGIHYNCFNNINEALVSNDQALPSVSLIQSGSNKGYGHGNNIGIRYALKHNSDYVLVLNNDTVVTSSFLEPLVAACENDTSIGIASGKIYFHDEPERLWFAGGKVSPVTARVDHFFFRQNDIGQIENEPITFITGCLWLIPSRVFKTIGFINEEYFMYVEDLEFCYRLTSSGFTLKVVPESKIFHKISSSTGGALSEFSVYWSSRNKIKFISDNYMKFYRVTALIYCISFPIVRWLYNRRFKLLQTHLRGICDGLRNTH